MGIFLTKNVPKRIISTLDIEVAVAEYFGVRRNIIVPNVWWGMGFDHEIDILVLTGSNHGYEVEIKVSKSDLKADLKKPHGHYSGRLRELWFAMPERMLDCVDLVPMNAGILIIKQNDLDIGLHCYVNRSPRRNTSPYKFSDKEVLKLARLGTMRVWSLKKSLSLSMIKTEESKNADK